MHWPAERPCPFTPATPALRTCWEQSSELIARLRDEFNRAGITDRVRTVYVSGSLGRMEAVESSDCDIVVVLRNEETGQAKDIMNLAFDCIASTGFDRPKPEGIFGSPTTFAELLDPTAAGKIDEDLPVFGKRIQALLDSQPLLHAAEFESLQLAILERYASAPTADPTASQSGWLTNDLIRYWHSLCARTRWLNYDDEPKWRMLNVKLRHSRVLLCAGLLGLLTKVSGPSALAPLLRLTPLERTQHIDAATEVAARYETFMAAMSMGLAGVVRNETAFADLIANGVRMAEALCNSLFGEGNSCAAMALFGELR